MRTIPQRKIALAHSRAVSIGCVRLRNQPGYYIHPEGTVYSSLQGALRPLTPHRIGNAWYVDIGYTKENLGRLVISQFVENPDRRSHFIHLDRDKSNCQATNLIWVEKSLLFLGNRLTIEDITKIEQLHGIVRRSEVADRFGLTEAKVTQIWIQARKMGRIKTVCRQQKCA
jgi:hypothetical protein